MYIAPKIISVNSESLKKHIKAAATSMCAGATADYVVGGGCGFAYSNGSCTASHNCDAGHY